MTAIGAYSIFIFFFLIGVCKFFCSKTIPSIWNPSAATAHPTLSKRMWWRDQRFKLPIPCGSLQESLKAGFSNASCGDETLLFFSSNLHFFFSRSALWQKELLMERQSCITLGKMLFWFFFVPCSFCETGNITAFRNPYRNCNNRTNYKKWSLFWA